MDMGYVKLLRFEQEYFLFLPGDPLDITVTWRISRLVDDGTPGEGCTAVFGLECPPKHHRALACICKLQRGAGATFD